MPELRQRLFAVNERQIENFRVAARIVEPAGPGPGRSPKKEAYFMLELRTSVTEDIPALRELWRLAFGDSEEYLDNFFKTYYRPERALAAKEDGTLCSMAVWFDTVFVVPGRGEYRAAYLYAVATRPERRGRGDSSRLLAWADGYFRSLGIPAVTTVPAEPSLHGFFGKNGFRECFRVLAGQLRREEISAPPSNLLRPASPEEYGRAREMLLKDVPHIAYPADALAYQAGCCALGDGGLFVGDLSGSPVCLCAERADEDLVVVKECLGAAGTDRHVFPDLPRIAPARRWEIRQPRSGELSVGAGQDLGRFAMLKWLDPAVEKSWDWDTAGYLGLAFD